MSIHLQCLIRPRDVRCITRLVIVLQRHQLCVRVVQLMRDIRHVLYVFLIALQYTRAHLVHIELHFGVAYFVLFTI